MPQYFTAYAAADLLERDQRTIRRAMRGIPAEHVDERGHDQWRLATIIAALNRHAGNGRGEPRTTATAAADEIERLAGELERGLARVRREPELAKRREMLHQVGPLVGALDRAMEAGARGVPDHERALLALTRDQTIGGIIGEVMELGSWQLADGAAEGPAA